jgi:hypothetical protein
MPFPSQCDFEMIFSASSYFHSSHFSIVCLIFSKHRPISFKWLICLRSEESKAFTSPSPPAVERRVLGILHRMESLQTSHIS